VNELPAGRGRLIQLDTHRSAGAVTL